jgi:hypothetical protein
MMEEHPSRYCVDAASTPPLGFLKESNLKKGVLATE